MEAEEVSPDSVDVSPVALTVGPLSLAESWVEEMAPGADAELLPSRAVPSGVRYVTAIETEKVSLDSVSRSSVVLTVNVLASGESWVKVRVPVAGA